MNKCLCIAVPEQLREHFPPASAPVFPRPGPPPQRAAEVVPHRRRPERDVREMHAFVPPFVPVVPRMPTPRVAAAKTPTAWWEDPVALGSLLILVPPIGLAAVWSSQRYSSDARWALTIMTALTMCLMTAVAIVAMSLR